MASSTGKRMRRRAEALLTSPAGLAVPALVLRAYLRRMLARTEWHYEGRDALAAHVRSGAPVILTMWHARLLSGCHFWDPAWGRAISLTSSAFPGRLGGHAMVTFGIDTQGLKDRNPSKADLVALAREVKRGASLVIQADGPLGPARRAKSVPLDWARLTGAPIWLMGYSATDFRQLDSWDRMVVPMAKGRACLIYRPWEETIPKRATDAEIQVLRGKLTHALDAVTEEADRRMGHPGLIA